MTWLKKIFKQYPWQVWAIILAAVVVQLILFRYKEVLHVDEFFSFGLANGKDGPFMRSSYEDFGNHVFFQDDFREYLVLGHNTFADMWYNLRLDDHMPAYFVLLRLFSLPFSFEFSLLPAVILHVLLFLAYLFGAYHLFLTLFKDKEIAVGGLFITAFCLPVLSMAVFIRMYFLWMMFCIYLTEFTILYLYNTKNEKKYLSGITIFSSLQILTHFYGFIFGFVLTMAACLILFLKREYRKMFVFSGFMLLSVFLAVLIFPTMIDIGLHGQRGVQFISQLSDYSSVFTNFIKEQVQFFIRVFFHDSVVAFWVFTIFVITAFSGIRKKVIDTDEKYHIFLLTLIFMGYGFLSVLMQPDMGVWQVRYFAPIFVIGIALFIYMIVILERIFKLKKVYLMFVLYLVAAVFAIYSSQADNGFWIKKDYKYRRIDNAVRAENILWGMSEQWMLVWTLHSFMDQLINVNSVFVIADVNDDKIVSYVHKLKKEHKYVYLILPKTQEISPEGAISWIKTMTNQQAFYITTAKNDTASGAVFEASVFLVAPY